MKVVEKKTISIILRYQVPITSYMPPPISTPRFYGVDDENN